MTFPTIYTGPSLVQSMRKVAMALEALARSIALAVQAVANAGEVILAPDPARDAGSVVPPRALIVRAGSAQRASGRVDAAPIEYG